VVRYSNWRTSRGPDKRGGEERPEEGATALPGLMTVMSRRARHRGESSQAFKASFLPFAVCICYCQPRMPFLVITQPQAPVSAFFSAAGPCP